MNWFRPEDVMPERDRAIEWQDSGGHITRGEFMGVWMMDSGMYIYYTPTFWRYKGEMSNEQISI